MCFLPPAVYSHIHALLIPLSFIFQSKHFPSRQSPPSSASTLFLLSCLLAPFSSLSPPLLYICVLPPLFVSPLPPLPISLICSPPSLTPLHHPVCQLCRLPPWRPSLCRFFIHTHLTSPSPPLLLLFSPLFTPFLHFSVDALPPDPPTPLLFDWLAVHSDSVAWLSLGLLQIRTDLPNRCWRSGGGRHNPSHHVSTCRVQLQMCPACLIGSRSLSPLLPALTPPQM